MGFTNTDRGCVGMTFVHQLLEFDTRANVEAEK